MFRERRLTVEQQGGVEVCMWALMLAPEAIKFIKDPTDAMKERAVKGNPWALRHIHPQTIRVQVLAVQQCGLAIQCCHFPEHKDVKWAAVEQNPLAIRYICKPGKKLKKLALHRVHEAIGI